MNDPVRGARLGRPTACPGLDPGTDPNDVTTHGGQPVARSPFRFYLQRVRLDAGGYDEGGAYWGLGAPLYRYEADSACPGLRAGGPDELTAWPVGFLRARDRQDAKAQLRADYPAARFYA